MRRFSTSLAIAVSMLLVASICSAQQTSTRSVPNLIRYGGVLKDAQGVALSSSTTVGVTFSIYKQQDGGAPVWMETQNVTSDASGQYSVLLGSTTATGLPSDLFSQEEQRWLGVQVQGQAEQSRVLLVSVPYAFKAHEAETLAGKSISDFVLAKDLSATNSAAGVDASSGSGSMQATAGNGNNKSASRLAILQGPTNFSGLTTDQIVKVTQSGTGAGVSASGASNAILGTATAATGTAFAIKGVATGTGGRGIFGYANSATGSTIGMEGAANSTSGVGLWGTATATSGPTVGVFSSVASPSGTAAVYNNVAGGKLLSGRNNGVEKFSVDGSGNVNSVSGTYKVGGSSVVSIGSPTDFNLFLGVGAGANNVAGSGTNNAFFGFQSGFSNTTGGANTFSGDQAGYSNTTGVVNTFSGYQAGYSNTSGNNNTFSGYQAGRSNSTGRTNTFTGSDVGLSNTTGSANTFSGYLAGHSNTTGSSNTFSGLSAGQFNSTASFNSFYGDSAGVTNSTGGNNSFFGSAAGSENTTGSTNTFSGGGAGASTTTGSNNTFYGFQAGYNNTTGNNDIYIGNPACPLPCSESNTIRIGGDNGAGYGAQTAAYIAGIYGNSPSGALPVVINANGQLGTGSSGGSGVTSWNGRTGAVVPQSGDYSLSLLSGTLQDSQLSGMYSSALMFLNTSNVYYGNGSNLTGVIVGAGSPYYIQNGTSQQASANFNISGSGSANSFSSSTTYGIDGSSVLGIGTPSDYNLFLGFGAGPNNVAGLGQFNVFSGAFAGNSNTTGAYNVFNGNGAGYFNTTGGHNTFGGASAGAHNTTGSYDTFSGSSAGVENTTGTYNTFSGAGAGVNNTTGNQNTFFGYDAGANNTTGRNDTYVGFAAGQQNQGDGNIYIGNDAGDSPTNESGTIRLGALHEVGVTYIAGIYGSSVGGSGIGVFVDSNGQLGTTVSSRRFKEQILEMGDNSSRLFQLRPVTFFYKPQYDDGSHTLQYGLIAEEVAKVYPDLVAYDRDGAPYTVKYQYLAPMLLNELQKQHTVVATQQDVIKTQQEQIQSQGQQIADLQQRLSRLESLIDKK